MKRTLRGVILAVALAFTASVASAQDMGMVTGSKKGTYYQFGLNMAELVKKQGVRLRVDDSQGSVQNVFSVYKAPDTQMGIVQSDVLAFVAKIQTGPALQGTFSKIVHDNIAWLRENGHSKWKTADLNAQRQPRPRCDQEDVLRLKTRLARVKA